MNTTTTTDDALLKLARKIAQELFPVTGFVDHAQADRQQAAYEGAVAALLRNKSALIAYCNNLVPEGETAHDAATQALRDQEIAEAIEASAHLKETHSHDH